MSHAATNWAIQQRGLKPTTKIVLWHLCDRFNPDFGCFPSQERLAHDCEIGRATLNRHLDVLEAHGLIYRIRVTDPKTKRQRPTRYLLGFEDGFPPPGPGDPEGGEGDPAVQFEPQHPCPEMRHGPDGENASMDNGFPVIDASEPRLDLGHGAVSHFSAGPCLKNSESRVSKRDTNPVREPLSKPVKEEEGARARKADLDLLFAELLGALGFDPGGKLPGWWQGAPARAHVRRWIDELGLCADRIIEVATETRREHPDPPDGPKALDRAMQRAAQRDAQATYAAAGDLGTSRRGKRQGGPPPSADELAAFYADLVNSDRYLPGSAISSTMRDGMLARGLVTPSRLRERGVQ